MTTPHYGVVVPLKDARAAVEIACMAEDAGWDGFFVGEAVWSVDAWATLAATAMRTSRIKLGTMLSPMPLFKPWKLAGESATLDHLSEGRAILSLGMGATWMGWQAFPDYPTDLQTRAEMLDEGIDILTLLYIGDQADYQGKHYQLKLTAMDTIHYPPPPVQQPRIPLWVVGVWPRKASMRRVLRCDGIIPAVIDSTGSFTDLKPEDICGIKGYIDTNRTLGTPFDIIVEGRTVGMNQHQIQKTLQPWFEAGATWWMETLFGITNAQLIERVRQGPPHLY